MIVTITPTYVGAPLQTAPLSESRILASADLGAARRFAIREECACNKNDGQERPSFQTPFFLMADSYTPQR
jgi:hypothetical protein